MLNTPFKSKENTKEMLKLYTQIFAVLMQTGHPLIQTTIWLNENFEELYLMSSTEVEVYEAIFEHFNVRYTKN